MYFLSLIDADKYCIIIIIIKKNYYMFLSTEIC